MLLIVQYIYLKSRLRNINKNRKFKMTSVKYHHFWGWSKEEGWLPLIKKILLAGRVALPRLCLMCMEVIRTEENVLFGSHWLPQKISKTFCENHASLVPHVVHVLIGNYFVNGKLFQGRTNTLAADICMLLEDKVSPRTNLSVQLCLIESFFCFQVCRIHKITDLP